MVLGKLLEQKGVLLYLLDLSHAESKNELFLWEYKFWRTHSSFEWIHLSCLEADFNQRGNRANGDKRRGTATWQIWKDFISWAKHSIWHYVYLCVYLCMAYMVSMLANIKKCGVKEHIRETDGGFILHFQWRILLTKEAFQMRDETSSNEIRNLVASLDALDDWEPSRTETYNYLLTSFQGWLRKAFV